jgi:hypothetical protein
MSGTVESTIKPKCCYKKTSCNKVINSWTGLCPSHEKLVERERKIVQERVEKLKEEITKLENDFKDSIIKQENWEEEFSYRNVVVKIQMTSDPLTHYTVVFGIKATMTFTDLDHMACFPCDDNFMDRLSIFREHFDEFENPEIERLSRANLIVDMKSKSEEKDEKDENVREDMRHWVIGKIFRHPSDYDDDEYHEPNLSVGETIKDFRSTICHSIDLILDSEGSLDNLKPCRGKIVGKKHFATPRDCH